jgi:hypothetical protein
MDIEDRDRKEYEKKERGEDRGKNNKEHGYAETVYKMAGGGQRTEG